MDKDYLLPIGHVAVFYLPAAKLAYDVSSYGHLQDYLRKNHFGYTMQEGKIFGYWMEEHGAFLKEDNVRFEVSFGGGDSAVDGFVNFLADLCFRMEEDAIYLTMGYKSYLVLPRKDSNGEV